MALAPGLHRAAALPCPADAGVELLGGAEPWGGDRSKSKEQENMKLYLNSVNGKPVLSRSGGVHHLGQQKNTGCPRGTSLACYHPLWVYVHLLPSNLLNVQKQTATILIFFNYMQWHHLFHCWGVWLTLPGFLLSSSSVLSSGPQQPEIIWRQLSERLTDALQDLKFKTAVVRRREGEPGA